MAKGKHATNGRDSSGKRLGVRVVTDQVIPAGKIIMRQRGTKILPGKNVGMASDHTIFSKITGKVKFEWAYKGKKQVSVYPAPASK